MALRQTFVIIHASLDLSDNANTEISMPSLLMSRSHSPFVTSWLCLSSISVPQRWCESFLLESLQVEQSILHVVTTHWNHQKVNPILLISVNWISCKAWILCTQLYAVNTTDIYLFFKYFVVWELFINLYNVCNEFESFSHLFPLLIPFCHSDIMRLKSNFQVFVVCWPLSLLLTQVWVRCDSLEQLICGYTSEEDVINPPRSKMPSGHVIAVTHMKLLQLWLAE